MCRVLAIKPRRRSAALLAGSESRLAIGLVLVATTAIAIAKPKLAITPIEGDKGGKVGAAIAAALGEDITVISRATVASKMERLGMSGELVPFDREKLKARLDATVLVQGKITNVDGRPTLRLTISTDDKTSKVVIRYSNPRSAAFRDHVRAAINKRLAVADARSDGDGEDREADGASEPPHKRKRAVVVDDDEADVPKQKPKKQRTARADDNDDGDAPADDEAPKKVTKQQRVADEANQDREDRDTIAGRPTRRRSSVLAAVRVDGGAAYGTRQLSYKASGDMVPPRLGTAAPSGRIAGELYPFAFGEPGSKAAGVGLVADFDKTVGLAVQIPGTTTQVPIDQLHYSVGGQYRLAVAGGALAVGVRYAVRKYVADRKGLMAPTDFDVPDVEYKATAPTLAARFPVTSRIAAFGEGDVLLITTTGPIQKPENYGAAKVFGFEAAAGTDLALASKLTLRLAGELSQINFTFVGNGAMATARGVKGAIDRSIGVVVTLAVTY